MPYLQSKDSNFLIGTISSSNLIPKEKIKLVGIDEIGYLRVNDSDLDFIATPAVYNCSIIVVFFEEFIFLAHISSKRTFKEFFSAIFRESLSLGLDSYSSHLWYYDKPYTLKGDLNGLPDNYNFNSLPVIEVGEDSLDYSYFVDIKKRKIVKHRRKKFFEIKYNDFY